MPINVILFIYTFPITSTSAYFLRSASTIFRCPPLTACIRLVSELRS